jgi:hypothetical protein
LTLPQLLAFLGGATLFAAVQAWLFQSTPPIPEIEDSGWFLNSGAGVKAVAWAFAAAGALIGLSRSDWIDWIVEEALLIAGGIGGMVAILFSIGPGTIFPIVIAFGSMILAGATAAGAGLGFLARRSFEFLRAKAGPHLRR